jgi:hypothetical protein
LTGKLESIIQMVGLKSFSQLTLEKSQVTREVYE